MIAKSVMINLFSFLTEVRNFVFRNIQLINFSCNKITQKATAQCQSIKVQHKETLENDEQSTNIPSNKKGFKPQRREAKKFFVNLSSVFSLSSA